MSILNAPGINASNTASFVFPLELQGTYSGVGANWIPGCEGYEVSLRIDGCNVYNDLCGEAAYPPEFGELKYVGPVECVDYLENVGETTPTGRCYQFMEDFKGSEVIQNFFWYSDIYLSEQDDGNQPEGILLYFVQ